MQVLQIRRATNTMEISLSVQIEGILFFEGGSVTLRKLAKLLSVPETSIEDALTELAATLEGRGISLVRDGDTVALGTAPSLSQLIESMRRDELEGPLGKAGLETLAILMYRGPLSRADIEYIRGVNATAILRSLMIRGLVARTQNPNDARSFLYTTTTELPAYFGVSSLDQLPDFVALKSEIDAVLDERTPETQENSEPI